MTGIRFAAQVSRQLWDMYLPLQSLIEMAIPVYPAPVKDELATSMAQHWSAFMAYARSTLQSMEILVLTFAASASLTALTNLGGIALLLLVRRQIRSNISNFGAHSAFQVPTLGADASQREKSASHGVRNTGSHSAGGDSAFSQDPVFLSTRSGAGGGIILSLIPATPRVAQEEPTPRCSEEPSSRKSSMQMSALASDAGSSQGKKTKAPSRAQIRRLAGQEAGGVAAAQAKNLQQLQRAEADLFITCCSNSATSIAFIGLSSWVYTILSQTRSLTWAQIEVAVFAGSWIFAGIHAIALSAHIYISWANIPPPSFHLPTTARSAYSSPVGSATYPPFSPPISPHVSSLEVSHRGDYFSPASNSRAQQDHRDGAPYRTSLDEMGGLHSFGSMLAMDPKEEKRRAKEEARHDPSWLSPQAAMVNSTHKSEEDAAV
ncbi:hypothetical protein JCM11641_006838 [Rhodosporidiobolus odoratus]